MRYKFAFRTSQTGEHVFYAVSWADARAQFYAWLDTTTEWLISFSGNCQN